MSTAGQFNTKSPTIKRILREASELASIPTTDYTALPLESNLFEWHFTVRGPPATPYADGIYHGRIVLPSTYPLRPPSFRFLTPSGRFEANREICLSISGHHEESWQPAWGIRTAIVAIRAFMEGDAKGQVGGVDASPAVRERLARESRSWKCQVCGNKTCEQIMQERQQEISTPAGGGSEKVEEQIPQELRLAYRDELVQKASSKHDASNSSGKRPDQNSHNHSQNSDERDQNGTTQSISVTEADHRFSSAQRQSSSATSIQQQAARPQDRLQAGSSTLDKTISAVTLALFVMIARKFLAWILQ